MVNVVMRDKTVIGASLSEPQYCQVAMVRTSRAQKFPIQIGKSPHLVVVSELPHMHAHGKR